MSHINLNVVIFSKKIVVYKIQNAREHSLRKRKLSHGQNDRIVICEL